MSERDLKLIRAIIRQATTWEHVLWIGTQAGVNIGAVIHRARERGVSPEVVLEGFLREAEWLLGPGAHGAEREFTNYQALAPGTFDVRVLDQADRWIDVLRTPHSVADREDLTDDYLVNLVGYLRANVAYLHSIYTKSFPERPVPSEPEEWLEATTLMRALLSEATSRGITLDDPGADTGGEAGP